MPCAYYIELLYSLHPLIPGTHAPPLSLHLPLPLSNSLQSYPLSYIPLFFTPDALLYPLNITTHALRTATYSPTHNSQCSFTLIQAPSSGTYNQAPLAMAKYRGKQQYFEPKYKETLITGLLGCRWRRYKQIKQSMSKV